MEHKIIRSRATRNKYSNLAWTLRCSCGRVWTSERWHCEEMFQEHLPVEMKYNCPEDCSCGNREDCYYNEQLPNGTYEQDYNLPMCPFYSKPPLWWDDASYIRYQSIP